MQEPENPIDIDSFWEYSAPAASEVRFREALSSTRGDERLELLTQIARTYSLRGRFDDAHELLNEVEEQLDQAGPRPRVRYLLERGRTYNSGGDKETGRGLFVEAWEVAAATNHEGLAVDAAHMVAITYSVGRCLRSLERYDEALTVQLELKVEHETMDTVDGYVFEEIAENLAALGKIEEARPYFASAYDELKKDDWLVKNEVSRLASLKSRAL